MNIIGIMTGNSLDACDLVLTRFDDGKMQDLAFASFPISKNLQKDISRLKKKVQNKDISLENISLDPFFIQVHNRYIKWVATSVKKFLKQNFLKPNDVDLIGFHGQTLDHNPPSVASSFDEVYTLQMGSGDYLSDLTKIPVVSDFRSDDIMHKGEGAPLIPPHNEHFAQMLKLDDCIFYNAGNTSNLAVIQNKKVIQGFDSGPFNEFSDYLVRLYKKESYDKDTHWGLKGKLDFELLDTLFQKAALLKTNKNFFLMSPPKSADPSLYGFKYELKPKNDAEFYQMLHTVQYFAGYIAAYSLKYVEGNQLPNTFVLFGGGWKNKVSFQAFSNLLTGKGFELSYHQKDFQEIRSRLSGKTKILMPKGADYMEARLMADLAYFFEMKKPWTDFKLTGVQHQVVLGKKSQPDMLRTTYFDLVSRANKSWQRFLKQ